MTQALREFLKPLPLKPELPRYRLVHPSQWTKEDAARWLCFISDGYIDERDWDAWIRSGLYPIAQRFECVRVLSIGSSNSREYLDQRFAAARRLLIEGWGINETEFGKEQAKKFREHVKFIRELRPASVAAGVL